MILTITRQELFDKVKESILVQSESFIKISIDFHIFCLMNSTYGFDLEKFKSYCDQTYELYVKEYEWFYMP